MLIWSGGNDHNISDAVKEKYAALCAGCEGSKRNGTKPLISSCSTVVRLVGTGLRRGGK